MKNRTPSLILLALATVVCVVAASAQTNPPNALVLPPSDWNPKTHILASLVVTNKPGDYPLNNEWVGVEEVTVRTGYFTNLYEMTKQTNRWHHYNELTVCRGPMFPKVHEDRFLSEGDPTAGGPAYRASLPGDGELRTIRDVSSLTNFLGWNPFHDVHSGTNHAAGWLGGVGQTYFTLHPYNSIETLYIEVWRNAPGTNIDGILIRRGRFHLEQQQ